MKIAIGHDLIERHRDGNPQSFSALWKAQADELGIEAEVIDPLMPGAIARIGRYDAFIWRYRFQAPWTHAAPRVMAILEDTYGLPVWPSRPLRLIFENKIEQAYLLDALDIPRPRTWVFWREADALAAVSELPLPIVTKLSRGIRSGGVALIQTPEEAQMVIRQMFSFGAPSMEFTRKPRLRRWGKYTPMIQAMRHGRLKDGHECGYVLFQEFLPGNTFDTRVVIQGDRAWALRRAVRENDFRASGSGLWDYSAKAIDPAALALSWRLADAMGVRSLVTDVLRSGDAPVIGELSYSMASFALRSAEGHWLRGRHGIVWVDTSVNWERTVFADFVAEVRAGSARSVGLTSPAGEG